MKNIYALLVLVIAAMLSYPVIAIKPDRQEDPADVTVEEIVNVPNQAGITTKADTPQTTPVGLSLFNTYLNSSYVADGIGVRNSGRGTINLRLPAGKTVRDAWIYWKVINATDGIHDKEITVNGIRVTGKMIGSGPSPCWAETGRTYRANILALMPTSITTGGDFGVTVGGINTKITDGRSPWDAFSTPAAEDAAIVIIYRETGSTTYIYDGYSEISGGTAVFSPLPLGTTMYTSIIADGQVLGITPYTKDVTYSVGPTSLQKVTLNGVDPSITSKATYQGSLSDTDTFILPSTAPAGASLTWTLANDCVAFNALIFSTSTSVP